MRRPALWRVLPLALGSALALTAPLEAAAQQRRTQTILAPRGVALQVAPRSFVDMRFEGIERQTLDLSCGAAALATLLRHYHGRDIGEREVIDGVLNALSEEAKAAVSQAGFSLLELKRYAEALGLAAGGFQLDSAEKLRQLRAPALTLIDTRGYSHFVVIRSVIGDFVHIADPAFGNRRVKLKEFAKSWKGVVLLVLEPSGELGEAAFLTASVRALTAERLQANLALRAAAQPKLPGEF